MAKKNKFKRNKSDIPLNIFDGGGIITDMYTQNISGPKLSQSGLPSSYQTGQKYGNMGNTSNIGSNLMSSLGNTALGAGMGFLGNTGGNLIAGGKQSGIGNTIGGLGNTIGGALMTVNPLVGGVIMGGTSLLGGAFNAAFGSKLNEERIAQAENEINAAKSFNANASNFDDLSQQIASATSIANFSKSDIGSDGWFSNKAKNKYKDLLAQKQFAEAWQRNSILNNATNLQQNQVDNLLQNYAAYGGLLDYGSSSAIDYDLANKQLGIESMKAMGQNRQYSLPTLGLNTFAEGGGIHIKPSKRGTFTAAAKKHGKGVQEFASQVLSNKENYSPAMVKKANFARNAAKWKHEDGGDLNGNNSNNSNSGLLSKTQELLDNIGYGNTPLSTIVPEEYKNIADGVWGGLEMFTPLGTIMGAADVANDIRNIYHKGNISSSDLGNLMLDSSGFIPGGKVLKKAAKSLSKVLPKKAEKLYTFADNLTYTTPKGIKEVKKRVADAKDFAKKEEKAAMNGLIIKNRNEALDAAMKIREASRFNQGILGGVDKALDSNAIQYNTTKNILQKADAINDTFGIMGNVENELNKKSFGGDLLTNGTVFSNNVIEVNNGGTHEENPMEGIQMGIDSNGIPNLVEEGELIWNDYVFSNRIPVPDAVRNKYKLRGTKDMTFSDAAKKIQKASEERPNDPIANDTLNINLTRLANEQEVMREQKNMKKNNKFKHGGKKNTISQDAWNLLSNVPSSIDIYDTTNLAPENKIPSLHFYNLTRQNQSNQNKQNNEIESIDDTLNRDNLLRYAPAFGSALGVGYGLLSKPNYSRADALAQFAQNAGKITPISYDPLGNYLTYKPTDMNYIANRMAAQAGATRRNIMNTSGGNRANAVGSLLAADYNSQIAQADALRQGEDTNWNRLMQTETFNRGTNQYNSEAALKAAVANQEARMKASQLGLSGYTNAMKMKDDIDAQRNASINANLTNLFDSLGNIGIDAYNRKDRDMLLRAGVFGTLGEKPQGWSEKRWTDYKKALNGTGYRNGGKLKKKRGGFTY